MTPDKDALRALLRIPEDAIFDLPIGEDVTYSRGYSAGIAAARESFRDALRAALAAAEAAPPTEYGRPPLDPATKAHDDAYMAGLIRGRELERESAEAAPPAEAHAEARACNAGWHAYVHNDGDLCPVCRGDWWHVR